MSVHPILTVDELRERIEDDDVRVVDCRWYLGKPGAGRAAYDEGHLPNAIHLDLDEDLSAREGPGRHPLPDPRSFAERLAARGIGSDDLVVAYDDVGASVAARLWWMLDSLGHERVTVLDGGIQAWTAAGLPLTNEIPVWPPARLPLADRWGRVIDRDELRRRLGEVVLLDARAAGRYRGEFEPIDPVAGHIPTALNAPTTEAVTSDWQFLPPHQLKAWYRRLGADGAGGPVVTSCGSGTNACLHAVAMRAVGLPDPILYPGSMSDWSRSGLPVAVGPEPGEPA